LTELARSQSQKPQPLIFTRFFGSCELVQAPVICRAPSHLQQEFSTCAHSLDLLNSFVSYQAELFFFYSRSFHRARTSKKVPYARGFVSRVCFGSTQLIFSARQSPGTKTLVQSWIPTRFCFAITTNPNFYLFHPTPSIAQSANHHRLLQPDSLEPLTPKKEPAVSNRRDFCSPALASTYREDFGLQFLRINPPTNTTRDWKYLRAIGLPIFPQPVRAYRYRQP
jgi:hypothetical protein